MWCRSLAEFPAQQSQAPDERPRKLSRPALTPKIGGLSETARSSSQCKFKSVFGPYAAFQRRRRARRPLAPRPRRARLEAWSGVGAGAMVPDKPWKKSPPGSEAATPPEIVPPPKPTRVLGLVVVKFKINKFIVPLVAVSDHPPWRDCPPVTLLKSAPRKCDVYTAHSAVRHVRRERATEGSSWRWRRKVSGDVEGGDGIGLRDPGNQRQRKDDQGQGRAFFGRVNSTHRQTPARAL